MGEILKYLGIVKRWLYYIANFDRNSWTAQNDWVRGLCSLFRVLSSTTFQKMDLYPSSCEERETPNLLLQWLRSVVSKGPNRVGVSLPSPEDGQIQTPKRCVSSSLEFHATNKVHKPNEHKCYAPPSEPFRF
jgi:hypothetical protein